MEALRIFNWIEKNLEECEDLRRAGKGLTGQSKDSWRFKVGHCTEIAEIRDVELIVPRLAPNTTMS